MSNDVRETLITYFDELRNRVATETGEWSVKGFIDVYQRIYAVSLDTKVLSKVLELLMLPVISKFASENGYRLELARQQNQYPDLSLTSLDGLHYAIDIKTTYRKGIDKNGKARVNGMTLGTFGSYFRARDRASITTYPYNAYARHYVLGIVYTQNLHIDEQLVYEIADLVTIPSVASDFVFFMHEKYQIAADRPGSGNTKNIGSTVFLDRLIEGTGVFADLGIEVFDDYWMNYHTREMSTRAGFSTQPYHNLIEYAHYKKRGSTIIHMDESQIESEADEDDNSLNPFSPA